MIKLKISHVVLFLILLFFLYVLNANIFERKFFINELLSLVGLSLFLHHSIERKALKIDRNKFLIIVVILLLIGLLYLFLSFPFKTNIYYYFRNSSLIYSIFTFFVGYYLSHYFLSYKNLIKWFLILSFILLYFTKNTNLFNYHSGSLLIPMVFNSFNIFSIAIMTFANFQYSLLYEQTTAIFIGLMLFFLFFIRSRLVFNFLLIAFILSFITTLIIFSYDLQKYKTPPYSLYGNKVEVIKSNPIFALDGNATFRFILYYRLLIEDFPRNLIGKGLGTPLIEYKKGENTTNSRGNDEYDAHLTGAHNTYLTVLSRMGITYLILILILISMSFSSYLKLRKSKENKAFLPYYWLFFSVCLFGLLNLLLETPTYSAAFWVPLGIISKSAYK